METTLKRILATAALAVASACTPGGAASGDRMATPPAPAAPAAGGALWAPYSEVNVQDKVVKSADEWRKILTPAQFSVLREQGTERAFTGALWDNHEKGVYRCAACGLPLFSSETKFESGTGWPSFWQPIAAANVGTKEDDTFFTRRTEVHCARCGGHLGHVFDDGPKPTGLRYCMNSVSLAFEPEKK